jgi:hypothetical protein
MMLKFTDAHKEKLTKAVDEAVAKAVQNVPRMVNDIVNKNIYSILGLDRTFSEPRVKDNSLLAQIIKERCKAKIKEIIVPVVDVALDKIVKDEKYLTALAKKTSDSFTENLNRRLRDIGDNWSDAQLQTLVSGLDKGEISFRELIDMSDVANPKTGRTKVGAILLEKIAERLNSEPKGKGSIKKRS